MPPFRPPASVARAAERALEVRASKPVSQRGMTEVGLARARDLINRRGLSESTVKRMVSYFTRHLVDKDGETWDERGKGWQAWNGWGGDPGARWAIRTVRREYPDWYETWADGPRARALLRHLNL